MNKKNKYKMAILFIISIFIIPDIIYAADYIKCGNDKYFPLALVNLVSIFFTIIKIAIPILFVISGMISFMKVTFSSNVDDDMKKAKSKLINNIIAAVVIFFIISIVNFAVGLVAGANNQFMNCVNCFLNPDKCSKATPEEVKKIEGNLEPGFIDGVNSDSGSSSNTNSQSTNNNTSQPNNAHAEAQVLTNNESKNLNSFLFIGDSRYAGIEQQLKSLGQNITVSAVQGVGATYWLNNISSLGLSTNKISIMLGVNETNTNQMISLLNIIHEKNPNAQIYVNSVYHIGTAYTSGYVNNNDIDNYNRVIEQYCNNKNWLKYIDITQGLYDSNGNLKNSYTQDGLHMNNEGNSILVANIKRQLVK